MQRGISGDLLPDLLPDLRKMKGPRGILCLAVDELNDPRGGKNKHTVSRTAGAVSIRPNAKTPTSQTAFWHTLPTGAK